MEYVRNCVSPADNRYSASASVIYDLLLVKSKLKLADVSVLSSTDVDFIIDTFVFVFVLTCLTFIFPLFLCTLVRFS